jgi:Omp85 superfamily domain
MVPWNNQRRLRVFCLLLASTCGGPCLCAAQSPAAPAELQSDRSLVVEPQDSSAPPPQRNSAPSTGNEPQHESEKAKKEKKKSKPHKGAFVIAPIPIVSPAIGSGLVPVLAYITPIAPRERGVTPSTFAVAGLITNNGSRGFVLGTDLYLSHSRYEVESGYVHGSIDYDIYGQGYLNGSLGLKLPLEQTGQAYFIKALRRIPWNIYVGGRFFTGSSFLTLKPTSGNLPPIPPGIGLHTSLRSLGAEAYRDTRPNHFYPLKGSLLDFTADVFAQPLGSKYSFQSYKFTFNKYVSLPMKQVLAYNLYYCATGGSPPFYAECIYGTNNELRGYTAGRYIDRHMIATQLEDRLVLPWRFGVVGFVGIGAVTPGTTAFRSNQFLPAGGTGIRYMLSKDYHVNLRTDFAWGRSSFTWAVGVGEAF